MQEAQTPILAAYSCGFGSVVFFASDLSVPPFSNWSGRGSLLLKILGINPNQTSVGATSGIVQRGYVDLSGQLRSALDQFRGARPVSFVTIALILLIYLLIIAPFDWFLVKRVLKKPLATWFFFPLYILIFVAITIGVRNAHTPKITALNQVDSFELDMTTGLARNTSWFGFYSPISSRYSLEYAPQVPKIWLGVDQENASIWSNENITDATVSLTPLSLAGAGLGGAEQRTYSQRAWREPYKISSMSDQSTITYLPMKARSSKSFVGRWTARFNKLPPVESLRDDGLVLHGDIINPFDAPIYSAYLIYDGGAYSLGTLAPGVTTIDRGVTRIEPLRVLNERQSSVPDAQRGAWELSNYNSASKRAPYILRTASFYNFGGGEDNFGIAKYLQRDVDLSEVLRCGRAVLFGTIVDPQSEEYKPTADQITQATDAEDHVRLEEKLAQRRGEHYRSARAEAAERYGFFGTTDTFFTSLFTRRDLRADENKTSAANEDLDSRIVVVRLIFPLERDAAK